MIPTIWWNTYWPHVKVMLTSNSLWASIITIAWCVTPVAVAYSQSRMDIPAAGALVSALLVIVYKVLNHKLPEPN